MANVPNIVHGLLRLRLLLLPTLAGSILTTAHRRLLHRIRNDNQFRDNFFEGVRWFAVCALIDRGRGSRFKFVAFVLNAWMRTRVVAQAAGGGRKLCVCGGRRKARRKEGKGQAERLKSGRMYQR